MAAEKPKTRKEFEAMIVAQAWKSADFRKRLLADPKAVVQAELSSLYPGAQIPPNMKVHVFEETPTEVYLVLPRSPQTVTEQPLTNQDLDNIAGGTGVSVVVQTVVGTVNVVNEQAVNVIVQVLSDVVQYTSNALQFNNLNVNVVTVT